MDMWTQLRTWINQLVAEARSLIQRHAGRRPRHRIALFESRGDAQAAARTRHVVAVFCAKGTPKWVYMMCPCSCGQQIALNLMTSQRPVWRISIRTETDFSIFPSVDATTCGAHFWVSHGRITWAE
jgi:hypothetical protein